MSIKDIYEASKFMLTNLGLGKFVEKNAGKLIGSAVKQLPERWKNKAVAAAELANHYLGFGNEISKHITAGVNEAKGTKTEVKTQTEEKESIPQPQPQSMPQPYSQTIQYVNNLGKAKHFRLRRRINRLSPARIRARLKLNSSKFASKRRTAPMRGRNIKFYKINE